MDPGPLLASSVHAVRSSSRFSPPPFPLFSLPCSLSNPSPSPCVCLLCQDPHGTSAVLSRPSPSALPARRSSCAALHQRAKARFLKSVIAGAPLHQQRTSQAAASSDRVRSPPSFRRRSPSDPVARAPSLLLLAVVFFLRAANARSGLCFEQRRRTPVSRRPSTAACPRPRCRQARRRRIHVSILPVLVHARFHRPSASSSAVADKTEAARETPWLRPLRPCARMPRWCSR